MIKFRCWDEDPPEGGWIAHLGAWYEEDSADCFDLELWLMEWYSQRHD